MQKELKISGRVEIVLRGPDGKIKEREIVSNLIVSVGKYHIADQLAGALEDAMSHMAIGTGETAAEASDTALQSELDRNALTSKAQGIGAAANTVIYTGDWLAGDGTGNITEAGIFNAASAGIMLCRTVFAAKGKGANDVFTLTWTLTISI